MEQKVYKSKISDLDQRIKSIKEGILRELELEKSYARDQFISEYNEFKVGDKVKVFTNDWGGVEKFKFDAFISDIHDRGFSGDVQFSFVGIKKDGTPSQRSAGWIWSSDKVRLELLNRKENVQASVATEAK